MRQVATIKRYFRYFSVVSALSMMSGGLAEGKSMILNKFSLESGCWYAGFVR